MTPTLRISSPSDARRPKSAARPLKIHERANPGETQLLILAFRLVRSRADAEAVIAKSGVVDRVNNGYPAELLRDVVVRECLLFARQRAVAASRFGNREIRRYQREIIQYLPFTDHAMEAALSVLPDRARYAIILHDVEAMSLKHISALLGVSAAVVRWYLHRARALVRLQLNGTGSGNASSSDR